MARRALLSEAWWQQATTIPDNEKGVHCFFIYTLGGIKAYHDIYDRPETLPLTKFTELKQLIIAFMEKLMKLINLLKETDMLNYSFQEQGSQKMENSRTTV